jgi:hypothetical protein
MGIALDRVRRPDLTSIPDIGLSSGRSQHARVGRGRDPFSRDDEEIHV